MAEPQELVARMYARERRLFPPLPRAQRRGEAQGERVAQGSQAESVRPEAVALAEGLAKIDSLSRRPLPRPAAGPVAVEILAGAVPAASFGRVGT